MGSDPPGAAGTGLLERERELEALKAATDRLSDGAGGLLLVEGPAGIGKTSLLAGAAAIARDRRLFVRRARGGPLEREMPFGIAAQLLEPVIERASDRERSRLLAGSAGLAAIALPGRRASADAPDSDPFAPIHGLFWLTANLADEQPVAMVIDDLQWSDSESLRWLSYLARRLEDLPVLVIGAVRTGEPDEPGELELLRMEAELLDPAPLSRSAIAAFVADALDHAPDREFTEACLEATTGNPFLLTEVIRTMRDDGIVPGADAARAVGSASRENIARYVLLRLARFGEKAVALAEAIATLGSSRRIDQVASLAGLGEDEVHHLIDVLRDAQILAPGGRLEFVHPLVRTAIYEEQSSEQRFRRHRRAAAVLERDGEAAREIAPHLMACSPAADPWVVERLADAAREAMATGAPDAAAGFLERALVEPARDPHPLRYELGQALRTIEPFRAPEVLAAVANDAEDPELRRRAMLHTAFAFFDIGRIADSVAWQNTHRDALPKNDRDGRLRAAAQLIPSKILAAEPEESLAAETSVALEGVGTTSRAELLLRQAVAFRRLLRPDPVDDVLALAYPMPEPPWDNYERAPFFGVLALSLSGRWEDARSALEGQLATERKAGRLLGVAYCYGFLSHVERCAGRLHDAEALARLGRELAGEIAPLSYPTFLGGFMLVAALIHRGRIDEADGLAESLPLDLGFSDLPTMPVARNLRGVLRLEQGELEAGVEDLLAVRAELADVGHFNPTAEPWFLSAAPALAALDRTAEAVELVEVAERQARRFGASHGIGQVLWARGLIEPRRKSIETLRESVACFEAYGPPHELARSLLDLGAALRRAGQRADSRAPLRRALELAHRCGAAGLEARSREELAAAGSRPRSAVRTGVDALTPSELRSAKLAARGLGNVEIAQRLFISRKTVEKHLGNAYAKLEIGGREELPRALDESS